MTDPARFASMSTRAQVHRLRVAAFGALSAWPLQVARLRLVFHGYNTTFRVDAADGRAYALRLNVNSRKSPAALRAEMAWLDALAADTDIGVPVPQRTVDEALTTDVFVPSLGRSLPVALFAWLPGPNLERVATPRHVRELGRVTAALHTHAEGWALPPGAELPSTDRWWTPDHHLLDAPHELLTPERRAVFERAAAQVRLVVAEVSASFPHHVLHSDLHLANAKWHRGRLSVFDFDDSLFGPLAHDLPISAYYLRPRDELVDALLEGYAAERPLPPLRGEQFETLLAARNLVLVDELVTTESADLRAMLPRFIANSEIRQRHFLDTGEFRHDLPGVEALF